MLRPSIGGIFSQNLAKGLGSPQTDVGRSLSGNELKGIPMTSGVIGANGRTDGQGCTVL